MKEERQQHKESSNFHSRKLPKNRLRSGLMTNLWSIMVLLVGSVAAETCPKVANNAAYGPADWQGEVAETYYRYITIGADDMQLSAFYYCLD